MKEEDLPSLGGRARARKLTPEQRKQIARKGAEAIRNKPRKKRGPYRKRKKIKGKKQKLYELLVVLHDHFAYDWRIRADTPIGDGPETISQRVALLLRAFPKKRRKTSDAKL